MTTNSNPYLTPAEEHMIRQRAKAHPGVAVFHFRPGTPGNRGKTTLKMCGLHLRNPATKMDDEVIAR